jgi:RimJ/RimL family protein N-acetyltransferase
LKVLETERLLLRWLNEDDAEFIMELVNEPSWLRFIGDRNVKTLGDARGYIANGPAAMYARVGFGLYLVERKVDGAPLGMCGLIKRDNLADVDIGFAFLPRYWGCGYAFESAAAVLALGQQQFGLKRIVAITSIDNESSIKLLQRIGLAFEKLIRFGVDEEEVKLFAIERG